MKIISLAYHYNFYMLQFIPKAPKKLHEIWSEKLLACLSAGVLHS